MKSARNWGRLGMKYNRYKIKDLISEISMGPFGSNIKVECFVDSGIPVLNGSNLIGFALNDGSFRYVTEEKANSLGKANAYRGDVVITHRGTLGQIVFIPSDSKFERYVISQSQFRVKCNEKIMPEYLTYYFHTKIGQHKLLSNASQVGVPALARASTSFQELEIEIPPMIQQQKVVSLLETIRVKIELNNAINDNLEQQAQAIFRQELLQNGELPPNWTTGSLLDIADYLNGLAMQKFRPVDGERGLPVLKIKELRQGFCDYSSELCSPNIKPEFIVHDGDVIFSWSGSLLVDLWCGGTCGINQHLFKVTSVKYPKWFYYTWTAHHLARFVAIAADKATTMGHIKREDLAKAEVIIPDVASMERIGGVLQPIYDLVINQRIENRKLSMLRDSLLPKLMSGELDVSAIEL